MKKKKKDKNNNIAIKFIKSLIILICLILFTLVAINLYIVLDNKSNIIDGEKLSTSEIQRLKDHKAEYIIVPGASVLPSGKPSEILAYRLDLAKELYFKDIAPKILISGDSRVSNYDEVGAMKRYLMNEGIALDDIVEDKLGISTKESITRGKNVYKINRAIIVTQKYHLYRALYLSSFAEIESLGVHPKSNNKIQKRELFARVKEFIIVEIERISDFF